MRRMSFACFGVVLAGLASGCVVGQPRGLGKTLFLREATTGAGYWLYLPVQTPGDKESAASPSTNSPKPLVLTLHGMKPFDSAGGQIHEWQQEADRYDFVVCAPELATPWVGSPLPLSDPNTGSLRRDEANVIAILNELYRTAGVDPNAVLITSWSYGGYLAHYFANRHPERFRALAVRQSNFSSDLMDSAQASKYRDRGIGIFYTENDFATCRRESHEAAQWYAQRGFDVTFGVFAGRGHERAPSLAAAFFARELGVEPRTPPTELATYQVREIPVSSLAAAPRLDAGLPLISQTPTAANSKTNTANFKPLTGSAASPTQMSVSATSLPVESAPVFRPLPSPKLPKKAPQPTSPAPTQESSASQAAGVHVNTSIGLSPLWLSYGAIMPVADRSAYDYSWYLNGRLLSSGANGQALITDAGDHLLEMVAKGKSGLSYKGSRTITVLPRSTKTN